MKEPIKLYELYATMIETAHLYTDGIERMKKLKDVIDMIPMKYVMNGFITIVECHILEEKIENKIKELKEDHHE